MLSEPNTSVRAAGERLPPRCATCIGRTSHLCGSFADQEIAALHAIARPRRLAKGEVLHTGGEPAMTCATVVTGALKIVRTAAGDRSQIVGLLFPPDFVGELFVQRHTDAVVALTETNLCVYPRKTIELLLNSHPTAKRALFLRALDMLADSRKWMLLLSRHTALEKVAIFLLSMDRRLRTTGDGFEIPMGRAEIGEVLGLTMETVSRQIRALNRDQLIALPGGRRVRILDFARLKQIAD